MPRRVRYESAILAAVSSQIRVRVLGRVAVDDAAADAMIGRGQARELLALLVAHPGAALHTDAVVEELWPDDPPATATTIVHGHVRRIRRALGASSVVHDGHGYRLELPSTAVDLWVVHAAVRAGDHRLARSLWSGPAFGPYADRAWARRAVAAHDLLRGIIDENGRATRAGRVLPVDRLVGRRRELAAVAAALARSRLVSIVGLGGVGKSRLALEIAAGAARAHQVDVGVGAGPMTSRIADAIGLTATGERNWDGRTIASTLGRRESLLVLDGCEHALTEVAALADELLGSCPELRILATSRTALGSPAEQVVPLLPFDDPGDPDGDAVDLLADRIATLGLPVEPGDRRRLAAVCVGTAGIPLAIELAATEATFGIDQAARGNGPAHASEEPAAARPADVVDAAVRHALGRLTRGAKRTIRLLAQLDHGFTPALLAGLAGPDVSAPGVLHELHAEGLVGTRPGRRLGLPDAVRGALAGQSDVEGLGVATVVLTDTLGAVRPDPARPIVRSALAVAVAELPNVGALLRTLDGAGRHAEALRLATAAGDAWGEHGHWKRGGKVIGDLVARTRPDGVESSGTTARTNDLERVAVDALEWAAAVRALATAAATYAAVRSLTETLALAATIARCEGVPNLEAHLRFQLAMGLGYGGDEDAAAVQQDRIRTLADHLDDDYVRACADHLAALGRLVSGDAAGGAVELEKIADRLTAMGAIADAARALRMAALAWRTGASGEPAYRDLKAAEALALEGHSLGTLATIRSDIVELRHERGDLDRRDVVDALDTVLGVGNLRAAGLLGILLGSIDGDPRTLAGATLDLLESDRPWAAVALAALVQVLPNRHRLHTVAPVVARRLRDQWGSPLGADESLTVDRLCGPKTDGPASDAVDAEFDELLREIVHERASTGRALESDRR